MYISKIFSKCEVMMRKMEIQTIFLSKRIIACTPVGAMFLGLRDFWFLFCHSNTRLTWFNFFLRLFFTFWWSTVLAVRRFICTDCIWQSLYVCDYLLYWIPCIAFNTYISFLHFRYSPCKSWRCFLLILQPFSLPLPEVYTSDRSLFNHLMAPCLDTVLQSSTFSRQEQESLGYWF